jgi:hypothetical protein
MQKRIKENIPIISVLKEDKLHQECNRTKPNKNYTKKYLQDKHPVHIFGG